mmetsp:Transcript_100071/g.283435  ORF Transcript_100071/g.283435 Transcript_100071/m.283435 type:complete len:206 (-) Transcript_100071:393-1010(-)
MKRAPSCSASLSWATSRQRAPPCGPWLPAGYWSKGPPAATAMAVSCWCVAARLAATWVKMPSREANSDATTAHGRSQRCTASTTARPLRPGQSTLFCCQGLVPPLTVLPRCTAPVRLPLAPLAFRRLPAVAVGTRAHCCGHWAMIRLHLSTTPPASTGCGLLCGCGAFLIAPSCSWSRNCASREAGAVVVALSAPSRVRWFPPRL